MEKTRTVKQADIVRSWHVVNVKNKVLGRVATDIAGKLMGKGKALRSPHADVGDFVVVLNAEQIAVTGNKEVDKMYYRHSGFPGGFRQERLEELRARKPEDIIRKAVKGMLPKNRLQDPRLARLKIYVGNKHPHRNHLPEEMVSLHSVVKKAKE